MATVPSRFSPGAGLAPILAPAGFLSAGTGLVLSRLLYERFFPALQIFGDDAIGFDAVITDQTMPDMTGMDLAKRLVELDSNVRIILASGYKVGEPSDSETKDCRIVSYLQKPFKMEEISLVLKEAILERT